MNMQDFLSVLEMDRPDDFQYFEQFAELMELEEDIPDEFIHTALSTVPAADLGDIIENYFEEFCNALPDEESEMVTLADSIEQKLLLLAEDIDTSSDARRRLIDELCRFRRWYNDPGLVIVDGKRSSILMAATRHREEALGGDPAAYDFSGALDYDLDSLSMSLGSFEKIDVVEDPEESTETDGNEE